IINIFVKGKKAKNLPNLLLISINDTRIEITVSDKDKEILPGIGFSFSLVNPLDTSEDAKIIRDHFTTQQPDWLKDVPNENKAELIGLRLWLRVLQRIQITTSKKPLAIFSNLSKSSGYTEKLD